MDEVAMKDAGGSAFHVGSQFRDKAKHLEVLSSPTFAIYESTQQYNANTNHKKMSVFAPTRDANRPAQKRDLYWP